MASITPAQFSFLVRQEFLLTFGLFNVFYGVCDGTSSAHMELMCLSPGVYVTLVAFLGYFFCECRHYATDHSMPILNRDESKEANIIQGPHGADYCDVYPTNRT
jgi:hypothetical protein